jgi:Bacteriophage head to tail connecting protein
MQILSQDPQRIIKKYDRLKADRATWETHWQDLADYILPNKDQVVQKVTVPGEKKFRHILDNSAIQANELLAGALHGLLTNPNDVWFELTTGDVELDDQDDIKIWLQDTARRMIRALNNSNFQTEVHEMYLDLGCFGTAPMLIEEDDKFIVRFSSKHIATCVVDENHLGQIDTLMREFDWDIRKIEMEFGKEALSEKMLREMKSDRQSEKKYKIIHAIYQEPGSSEGQFVSQYILKEEKRDLRVSRFNEFPYVVPRWSKLSDEMYGRSPGMVALPEAKMINKMSEAVIKGAQKTIDPPLQVPHDGFIMPIRTKPGSINFYMAGTGSRDEIKPIFNDARIDFGFQVMEQHRQRIRESFFVDQLQLNQGPQMTATEVLQRTEEKMRLLGPLLGRQQSEFLRPLIERVFNIMARRNLFLEPPESIAGMNIDVQYSSFIAKTQRINQGNAILRAVEASAPFIQLDPSVADLFNGEEAVKEIWRIYGASQRLLRGQEELEQIREAKAQAQQDAIAQQEEVANSQMQNTMADTRQKLASV